MLLAVALGLFVWRRPQDPVRLLWLAAAVLASRCLFVTVMTPHYLPPPLILALVMAARRKGGRFLAAAVIALGITVFAYHHLNPWAWWLPAVVGLGAVLVLGNPDDVSAPSGPVPEVHRGREASEPDSPQLESRHVPEYSR